MLLGEGVPPQEFLTIDLSRPDVHYQSVPTPTDDRGLIIVDELVETVLEYVDPDYDWPAYTSHHHAYNHEAWYPNFPEMGDENPYRFRNLPVHLLRVPRQFENLVHWVTEPAPVPEPEVRIYRVEAWRVASSLFEKAYALEHWEWLEAARQNQVAVNPDILRPDFNGEDIIGNQIIEDAFERHFRTMSEFAARNASIPEEFRVIESADPSQTGPIIAALRAIVSHQALNLVPVIREGLPLAS